MYEVNNHALINKEEFTMGKIEWFDKWQRDIRKKTYDELDTGDKALLRSPSIMAVNVLIFTASV